MNEMAKGSSDSASIDVRPAIFQNTPSTERERWWWRAVRFLGLLLSLALCTHFGLQAAFRPEEKPPKPEHSVAQHGSTSLNRVRMRLGLRQPPIHLSLDIHAGRGASVVLHDLAGRTTWQGRIECPAYRAMIDTYPDSASIDVLVVWGYWEYCTFTQYYGISSDLRLVSLQDGPGGPEPTPRGDVDAETRYSMLTSGYPVDILNSLLWLQSYRGSTARRDLRFDEAVRALSLSSDAWIRAGAERYLKAR